jgi:ubiquinone/menaquinone biosynthesis C-methylase UbiE
MATALPTIPPDQQPGQCLPLGAHLTAEDLHLDSDYTQNIIQYYSQAGMDYEPWSQKYNMHFGYFRWGVNFLIRERLLDEMNNQVLQRLQMKTAGISQLIDLGCGVGATVRYCANRYPNSRITGATIVPWQIDKAIAMTPETMLDQQVCFKLMDYRNTPFEDNVFDGEKAAVMTRGWTSGLFWRRLTESSNPEVVWL